MSVIHPDSKTIPFENAELDRRIGGIPFPSLTLIEGPNDSGKSVLSQQICYGALRSGYKVMYITTESTARGLLSHMLSLGWDVSYHFMCGDLIIKTLHVKGIKWNSEISRYFLIALLNFIKRRLSKFDVLIIDSLTYIVTHATPNDVLEFFSECRNVVDSNSKLIIITIHPYAFDQDLLIRVRSICDGHFLLSVKTFRNKNVLVLTVAKLKGALQTSGDIISFEVDPAFGIKVLPFTAARA